MIYGIGYVEEDGGQTRWAQYLEYHNLTPVPVSGTEINRVVGSLIKECGDSCVPDVGYLINGVLVQHTDLPAREKDAGVLAFRSNSKRILESLVRDLNLPIPQAFEKHRENGTGH